MFPNQGLLLGVSGLRAGVLRFTSAIYNTFFTKSNTTSPVERVNGSFGEVGASYSLVDDNGSIGDPHYSNVVSLLHFDGSNGSTTFKDEKGKVWTANGNAQISTAQSQFGGASLLLDGNGDYISTPIHVGFDFGTKDFTIETWIRFNTAPTVHETIFTTRPTGSSQSGITLHRQSDGDLQFNARATATLVADIQAGNISDTNWHHVAATRLGDLWYLFLDGILEGTTTASGTIADAGLVNVGFDPSNLGPRYLNGNIDDLRITKGVARYTADFIAPRKAFPNTPGDHEDTWGTLTWSDDDITNKEIMVPLIQDGDPYFDQVVSLLHFDSTLVDIAGPIWTANGNAAVSSVQSKFGGSSLALDGNGDYLSTPDSEDFNLGEDDFTIEAWVRCSDVSASNTIVAKKQSISTNASFSLGTISGSGALRWRHTNNGSTNFIIDTDAGVIVQDIWRHVAVCRNGGALNIYVNGELRGNGAISGAIFDNAEALFVGATDSASPTAFFNGYIDDFRITKGVARYTEDFIVPTKAFPNYRGDADPYYDNVASLLHMNGTPAATTILDNKGKIWTAAGNAQLSNTARRFGNTSLFLDGTGDYISTPDHVDWHFGSGDFTIECWIRITTLAGSAVFDGIITHRQDNGVNHAWSFYLNQNNQGLGFTYTTGGSSATENTIAESLSFLTNTWYHVAVSRQGSMLRIFRDGIETASEDIGTASFFNSTTTLNVGRLDTDDTTSNHIFHGYIDDVRITKGVARYTENFTPSDRPFPNELGSYKGFCDGFEATNAMLLHFNGTDGATSFTDDTGKIWTRVGSTAQLDTSIKKFGTASLQTDGAASYFTTPDHEDFNLAHHDFTFDVWVYPTAAYSTNMRIMGQRQSSGPTVNFAYLMYISASTGIVRFEWSNTGTDSFGLAFGTTSVPLNTWTHIALVRAGNKLIGFINGEVVGVRGIPHAIFNSSWVFGIAASADAATPGDVPFIGRMDEMRLVKGYAVWKDNFTPPLSEYKNLNFPRWDYVSALTSGGITRSTTLPYSGTAALGASTSSPATDTDPNFPWIGSDPLAWKELNARKYTGYTFRFYIDVDGNDDAATTHLLDGNQTILLNYTGRRESGADASRRLHINGVPRVTLNLDVWYRVECSFDWGTSMINVKTIEDSTGTIADDHTVGFSETEIKYVVVQSQQSGTTEPTWYIDNLAISYDTNDRNSFDMILSNPTGGASIGTPSTATNFIDFTN